MQLEIYSYLSDTRAGLGAAPAPAEFISMQDFQGQNLPFQTDSGEIMSQYLAWRAGLQAYDYVGFEDAARPLFIDPMRLERLLPQYKNVLALRDRFARRWDSARIDVPPHVLTEVEAMRAACDDAELGRIARWLERCDVVTPPVQNVAEDRLRQLHFQTEWAPFAAIASRIGVFAGIPVALYADQTQPLYNAFIIRTALFEPFIVAFFEALFEYRSRAISNYATRYLAERLFGVYLRHLLYTNPLHRRAEVPLLWLGLSTPPACLPAGFDASAYFGLNPDVAAVGTSAEQHYRHFGWREQRAWRLSCA